MNILFISAEMSPLAKSGGLGDVVGALPKALRQKGHDARVIMPLYRGIRHRYMEQLNFVRWSMIRLGWRTMYSGLFSLNVDGIPVYLIDNEFYFGHDELYLEYAFDIERFSFFQRAVLEAMGLPMGFDPDILHIHDWQAGMIPVLLEAHYKSQGYFAELPSLLTIHNLKFQGIHGREQISDYLELPNQYMSEAGILKDGVPNFLKSGIVYADRVNTVSPSYAKEILQDFYGEGLNGLLGVQRDKLSGILNGIDTESYNPETDKALAANYSKTAYKRGKSACKKALQAELGLPVAADKPILAMISRLTEQKGVDLLMRIADELLEEDVQLIVLGTGDFLYEEDLRKLESRHPNRMRAKIGFDPVLARRVYAGADMLLIPSLFEPCGLTQMIAMRYGTVPIVRKTGGLIDTVEPYNKFEGTGDGFAFLNINAHELLFTIKDAVSVCRDQPKEWAGIVQRGLNKDFSWAKSADEYIDLYESILKDK
ncbi:MAG TPA: glycogen synthase GlgA [Clostridiaceae bacterium]|nr:glycogen synthase GlgA [Clostridiaceae bacterium]